MSTTTWTTNVLTPLFSDDVEAADHPSGSLLHPHHPALLDAVADAVEDGRPPSADADPVLTADVPRSLIGRDTVAMLELDSRHAIAAAAAAGGGGGGEVWCADLEACDGGFTEALCVIAARGGRGTGGLRCVCMSAGQAAASGPLRRSVHGGQQLPQETFFAGADGSGDVRGVSNLSAFAGAARLLTGGGGLHVVVGAARGAGGDGNGDDDALVAARVLGALLTLREGGAFVLRLPRLPSLFAASVAYVLRGSFESVHLTQPRVVPQGGGDGDAMPGCYAVCLGRRGAPSFAGPLACDDTPLVKHLYTVVASLGGSGGGAAGDAARVVSLVDPAAMKADAGFVEWFKGAGGAVLEGQAARVTPEDPKVGGGGGEMGEEEEEEGVRKAYREYYAGVGLVLTEEERVVVRVRR